MVGTCAVRLGCSEPKGATLLWEKCNKSRRRDGYIVRWGEETTFSIGFRHNRAYLPDVFIARYFFIFIIGTKVIICKPFTEKSVDRFLRATRKKIARFMFRRPPICLSR